MEEQVREEAERYLLATYAAMGPVELADYDLKQAIDRLYPTGWDGFVQDVHNGYGA